VPESIADLGWRLPPLFDRRGVVDPWGRAWSYRVLPDGAGFELATLGPDGVKSGDDISVRHRFPARAAPRAP
jgi:hypothetical protein